MEIIIDSLDYSTIIYKIIPILIGISILRNTKRHTFSNKKIQETNSTIINIFNSYAGIDFFLRFIQFTLVFIAGTHQKNARFKVDHQRLILMSKQQQLDKISNICGILRKITRLPRTRFSFADVYDNYIKSLAQQRTIVIFEYIFWILADFLNASYFIIDHIICLFLLDAVNGAKQLALIDFWGNYIWTWTSVFYLMRDIVIFVRMFYLKEWKGQQLRKKKIYLFFDTLRNVIDIFANIAFLYPRSFSKDIVGLMGMISAFCWLTDFHKY